jgi:Tfp pilus assembly protein PilN
VIRINLAPPERRVGVGGFEWSLPQLKLNLGLAVVVVYAVVALGLAVYIVALWRAESRLSAQIVRDQQELATLKVQLAPFTRVKEQAAEMQRRVQTIEQLTKNQGRPILILDAFLDAVPPDLWITSLAESGAALRVSGSAFSTTAVSDFMSNLRRGGKFLDVDITVAKQDVSKSPSPVTFEVTCRFGG